MDLPAEEITQNLTKLAYLTEEEWSRVLNLIFSSTEIVLLLSF